MKTSFAAACILAIFVFSAPAASAQQMQTFHCIATSITPGAAHTTIYVSQVFPMENSQHAAIDGAWATYIKATYHLTTISITRCDQLGVSPTMQERILAAEETSWKNQGWEVVHVKWRPRTSRRCSLLGGIAVFSYARPGSDSRATCNRRAAGSEQWRIGA